MKVVAFNGSPHKDGNTATLLAEVLRELESQGIETELVHLKGPWPAAKPALNAGRRRTANAFRTGI